MEKIKKRERLDKEKAREKKRPTKKRINEANE